MKVVSVTKRLYCHEEYAFDAPGGIEIPIGAKVTVEWDDNVHECEKLEQARLNVKRYANSDRWYVSDSPDGYIPNAVMVWYCPGCGKKLGG